MALAESVTVLAAPEMLSVPKVPLLMTRAAVELLVADSVPNVPAPPPANVLDVALVFEMTIVADAPLNVRFVMVPVFQTVPVPVSVHVPVPIVSVRTFAFDELNDPHVTL